MSEKVKKNRWTPQEISALMDMRNDQGFNFSEIATELNRTEIAVSARYSQEKRRRFNEQREKRKAQPYTPHVPNPQKSDHWNFCEAVKKAEESGAKEYEFQGKKYNTKSRESIETPPLAKSDALKFTPQRRYTFTIEGNDDVIIWDRLSNMPYAVLTGTYNNEQSGSKSTIMAAERIVSCLNAMDGISTPEIEIPQMISAQNKLTFARRHTIPFLNGLVRELDQLSDYVTKDLNASKLLRVLDLEDGTNVTKPF